MSNDEIDALARLYFKAKAHAAFTMGIFDAICHAEGDDNERAEAWIHAVSAMYFRDGIKTTIRLLGLWDKVQERKNGNS